MVKKERNMLSYLVCDVFLFLFFTKNKKEPNTTKSIQDFYLINNAIDICDIGENKDQLT